jgi:hypothetical protein
MKKPKTLTPARAYKMVERLAHAAGLSVSAYAESCGVQRFVVSKWRHKTEGSFSHALAQKLGIV